MFPKVLVLPEDIVHCHEERALDKIPFIQISWSVLRPARPAYDSKDIINTSYLRVIFWDRRYGPGLSAPTLSWLVTTLSAPGKDRFCCHPRSSDRLALWPKSTLLNELRIWDWVGVAHGTRYIASLGNFSVMTSPPSGWSFSSRSQGPNLRNTSEGGDHMMLCIVYKKCDCVYTHRENERIIVL